MLVNSKKNKIVLLTDYKGFYGLKQKSKIYRGGMDILRIKELFKSFGYDCSNITFSQIDFKVFADENPIILYTSSEDNSSLYKSFIEDIIYHLEKLGLSLIPKYEYLKAHNNKVAMELMRDRSTESSIKTINSKTFGTLEELKDNLASLEFPVILKSSSGAMSKGVFKANSPKELISRARKVSSSIDYKNDLKEILRTIKYYNRFRRESFYRKKFIVQNFIENLSNDWKVLVFGNRCYILYRGLKKGDFRASGSGNFIFKEDIPSGILDFAQSIQNHFGVPHISLDIGFDGKSFHLIEFQFIFFGTTTLEKAPFYYLKDGNKWIIIREKSELEEVYVSSIVEFIKK
jgi:glutathione synthase/RimK-type ligase-like ATP-grasp enzyme